VWRAINAVGVYVPGGTAVLPSSALMLTVPAAIAGCGTIVLATPPRPDGSISPEVVYCARKAGATHVLKAGGAQAVAALGWGTETTPKVDKVFGPGNQFVTAAKMRLQGSEAMVAIDMPAGPSEVLVIADAGAPLPHVAADLLSQAEHGPDSQVCSIMLAAGCPSQVYAATARGIESAHRSLLLGQGAHQLRTSTSNAGSIPPAWLCCLLADRRPCASQAAFAAP
jgi:histidinol dehydrogenase